MLIACSLLLGGTAPGTAQPAAAPGGEQGWGPLEILGRTIAPGESRRFRFMQSPGFEAAYIDIPVFVARGALPGPMLCVTAGIHGDEINGVEIARRVFDGVSAGKLNGTLVVLPIVNRHGFMMRQRYMADRMDLNRYFPGRPDGNISSVVAHAVFTKVIKRCDALIDLHTAAFYRANLPQIRVDLNNPRALEMARHFGAGIILGKPGSRHTLRWQATNAGIPTILYEGGESNRFQAAEINSGWRGCSTLWVISIWLTAPPTRRAGSRSTPLQPGCGYRRAGVATSFRNANWEPGCERGRCWAPSPIP